MVSNGGGRAGFMEGEFRVGVDMLVDFFVLAEIESVGFEQVSY